MLNIQVSKMQSSSVISLQEQAQVCKINIHRDHMLNQLRLYKTFFVCKDEIQREETTLYSENHNKSCQFFFLLRVSLYLYTQSIHLDINIDYLGRKNKLEYFCCGTFSEHKVNWRQTYCQQSAITGLLVQQNNEVLETDRVLTAVLHNHPSKEEHDLAKSMFFE